MAQNYESRAAALDPYDFRLQYQRVIKAFYLGDENMCIRVLSIFALVFNVLALSASKSIAHDLSAFREIISVEVDGRVQEVTVSAQPIGQGMLRLEARSRSGKVVVEVPESDITTQPFIVGFMGRYWKQAVSLAGSLAKMCGLGGDAGGATGDNGGDSNDNNNTNNSDSDSSSSSSSTSDGQSGNGNGSFDGNNFDSGGGDINVNLNFNCQ
ncbi:hypothetical protein [Sulfitobacter noctilucae]|uniref:hypothetical protein n=1 Tax=Sulfitobacter noctilucae TaxID=1342302 RepID=UPI00046A8952|nr:hypothetical protein [Sulfitobacter noctilucae]